jgi:hypothetical protein
LAEKGHEMKATTAGAAVNSIERGSDGRIYANADYRNYGGVDGF